MVAVRLMMHASFLAFIVAFSSHQWVCREDTSVEVTGEARGPQPASDTLNSSSKWCVGLWKACDGHGRCDKIWNMLTSVNQLAVVWVQCTATVALVSYSVTMVLDLLSQAPPCVQLATNRLVELSLAISAVTHFVTLLYWTGQVKNKAARTDDPQVVIVWGFGLTACSLGLTVVSAVVMATFRLPPPPKHRRFWRMPRKLQAGTHLSRPTLHISGV